jgi:hypothetical protein
MKKNYKIEINFSKKFFFGIAKTVRDLQKINAAYCKLIGRGITYFAKKGNYMSITLQRSLFQVARSFHTTPKVEAKAWKALKPPIYVGQTNIFDVSMTERIKHAVYRVNTDVGTCFFNASLGGRVRIITSNYKGKTSPPMYEVRATSSDLDVKARVIIFKDRRATYVYPTPLHFSPHNETPPLVKKVSNVILACGERQELEFSESQVPDLPLPFLEEIQRLIRKTS